MPARAAAAFLHPGDQLALVVGLAEVDRQAQLLRPSRRTAPRRRRAWRGRRSPAGAGPSMLRFGPLSTAISGRGCATLRLARSMRPRVQRSVAASSRPYAGALACLRGRRHRAIVPSWPTTADLDAERRDAAHSWRAADAWPALLAAHRARSAQGRGGAQPGDRAALALCRDLAGRRRRAGDRAFHRRRLRWTAPVPAGSRRPGSSPGGRFRSRLIVGTGKYKDLEETAAAIEASGAEIVTVAVRRVNLSDPERRRCCRISSIRRNTPICPTPPAASPPRTRCARCAWRARPAAGTW